MDESAAPAAVVHVGPTGDYIGRAEFVATVTPMKDDITEIKGDVKQLLARDAGRTALADMKTRAATVATTVSAGAIGALITLFTHH